MNRTLFVKTASKLALILPMALGMAQFASAAPPRGGGMHPGWGAGGNFHAAYPAYRHAYPGWRGGYWGPRHGAYYGWPGYWGAWPYAAAVGFGVGYGAYAWGYPYVGTYLYTPPVVVTNTVQQPQVFIQRDDAATEPQPTTAPPAPTSYWYYCPQPAGYFPYVKDCNQQWLKVIPQAPGESATAPRLAP